MIITAFDPGKTTGWFIGDVNKGTAQVTCLGYGEVTLHDGLYNDFRAAIIDHNVKVVLVEGVVPYGSLNIDKINQVSAYTHVRVMANTCGLPVTVITPEERKRAPFLSKSGVPAKMGHARDAAKLVHAWVQRV